MKLNQKLTRQIAVTVIAIIIIVFAFTGSIDGKGKEYTENSFNKALITFALARGLNGMISVAQGTEVAIHPAGFGVNFTPGQILDPINDLVEQFSWIMLASSASLGIQRVFLNISSHWVTSMVLGLLIVCYAFLIWREKLLSRETRSVIGRLVMVALFVRFSIPVAAIGTEYLSQYFLDEEYKESTANLEKTRDKLGDLNEAAQTQVQPHAEDESVLDKAKRMLDSASAAIDINKRIEQYKSAATDASKYTINLIVVFVIQTVLFPLLFLAAIYKLLKAMSGKLIKL